MSDQPSGILFGSGTLVDEILEFWCFSFSYALRCLFCVFDPSFGWLVVSRYRRFLWRRLFRVPFPVLALIANYSFHTGHNSGCDIGRGSARPAIFLRSALLIPEGPNKSVNLAATYACFFTVREFQCLSLRAVSSASFKEPRRKLPRWQPNTGTVSCQACLSATIELAISAGYTSVSLSDGSQSCYDL